CSSSREEPSRDGGLPWICCPRLCADECGRSLRR
ncbi:hypothetical protein AK812_SmicGene48298, partial [Symbiodinium microadriaticum]